jgi:hypothetical protein
VTNEIDLDPLRQRYRTGMCDVLALAVHQRTGWPLALWSGEFEDDLGEPGETWHQPQHAVVIDPGTGAWFDVDGFHPAGEVPVLHFDQQPLAVSLQPASPQEVAEAFTAQDTPQDQLDQALLDLQALGWLEQLPARRARPKP